MSYGMTPYEFVQQVFYAQEKVVLDFWPTDDKYKEVLFEANLVLQELQNQEDWSWLRERLVLGPTDDFPHAGQIPEYELPDWVYKPSTLHNDCVRLYAQRRRRCHGRCSGCGKCIDEWSFIEAPYTSRGNNAHHGSKLFVHDGAVQVPDVELRAVNMGNIITFNRPLVSPERHRIAVCDVQHRIRTLHICDDSCVDENGDAPDYTIVDGKWKSPCAKIEKRVFTEIPDPNYMVFATAARHAEGSPIAQGRLAGLQDTTMKIMSAMRQNVSASTDADFMEWDTPGYIEIV